MPLVGVIDSFDPKTRWVTFRSLDPEPGRRVPLLTKFAQTMAAGFADNGVLVDRIRWIEPAGGDRIRLNERN
jgi:hypothetical protein